MNTQQTHQELRNLSVEYTRQQTNNSKITKPGPDHDHIKYSNFTSHLSYQLHHAACVCVCVRSTIHVAYECVTIIEYKLRYSTKKLSCFHWGKIVLTISSPVPSRHSSVG